MGCLQENTVLAFAEAGLSAEAVAEVEAHARVCASCHEFLAAALRAPGLARTAATQYLGPESPSGAALDGTAAMAGGTRAQREPLAPGTRLDRYSVLGLVGRGGMGEVYAAYDPDLDRRVALKLMSGAGPERDPIGQERLLREARAIARLSHPNAVVVYEVGTFRCQVFISMEFVDGVTLAAWLLDGPRTWRAILEVFLQAARGLSAAHGAGLVHRDFKPQNVMVARDGSVRVTDFGLARRAGEVAPEATADDASNSQAGATLTRTGQHVGTPLFMAPEQFANGPIDGRTDQFSFCVALYWALYGAHPFGGSSAAQATARGAGKRLEAPITKHAPPANVHAALARGLSLSLADRWPSMDALAAALSHDPARRRRRGLAIGAGALVVAAVAAGGTSLAQRARTLCMAGPSRLADVWELDGSAAHPGSRREVVHDAVTKSGSPEARTTWERAASILDRHASRWIASYREACEATHVRGEQSEEVLDLRMTCLNDNLDSMRALTHLLSGGEKAVMDHAVEAAGSLDGLSRCEASEQLRSAIRPPKDPVLRRKVAELKKRLKEGDALFHAGQDEQAAALADDVLAQSEALGDLPTQAEALQLKAESTIARYQFVGPSEVSLLERAIFLAESCGHDKVVAAAAALLIQADMDDPRGSQRWADLSVSVIRRMGGDLRLEGWVANDIGALRYFQGRFEDAERETERARALKERALGPDHLDVAKTLTNLSLVLVELRKFDRALAYIQRSRPIYEHWLGPRSTELANFFINEGHVLVAVGRADEAGRSYLRALEIASGAGAKPAPLPLIQITKGLADVAQSRGAAADATAKYEKALAMIETLESNHPEYAQLRFEIAVAMDKDPRTKARGIEVARRALWTYAQQEAFENRRREVQAWLDERLPPSRRTKG